MRSTPNTFLDRALIFVLGALVALVFILMMIVSTGCSGNPDPITVPCPECPVIEEETFACPDPGELPPLVVPSFPPRPLEILAINEWAVSMAEAIIAREGIYLDRIEELEKLLDEYRRPPPD